jgi:hypothetical protein
VNSAGPDLEEYTELFREFDDGSGTVSAMDLERLLRRIPQPLGIGKGASRLLTMHFIKGLNLPLQLASSGSVSHRVPFRRTAFELVRRVSECDMPAGTLPLHRHVTDTHFEPSSLLESALL